VSQQGGGKRGERKASLLEVSSVLLVNEDQVQVVPCRELLVDVTECWCELEAAKEESDWDRLACVEEGQDSCLGREERRQTYLAPALRP
jgi:hypothetical protein